MFFVAGIGALALSAIYLTANASLLSKTYEKEDDLKYASEAALQIGKAELNFNPAALPNTSLRAAAEQQDVARRPTARRCRAHGESLRRAERFDERPVRTLRERRRRSARPNGTGFVRRLELTQESFAKYAYWTNSENNAAAERSCSPTATRSGARSGRTTRSRSTARGATFHDDVGTAAPSSAARATARSSRAIRSSSGRSRCRRCRRCRRLQRSGDGRATTTCRRSTTGDETTVRHAPRVRRGGSGRRRRLDRRQRRILPRLQGDDGPTSSWLRGDWPGRRSCRMTSVSNCGDWHTSAPAATSHAAVLPGGGPSTTRGSTRHGCGHRPAATATTRRGDAERNATLRCRRS